LIFRGHNCISCLPSFRKCLSYFIYIYLFTYF
jgi:hypothetical protein